MNADDRLLLTFVVLLLIWLLIAGSALVYSRRGKIEAHLNIVSVLGAVVGYLALTQEWRFDADGIGEVLAVVLFMFGSLAAVFTPVGGFLQLVSIASVLGLSSSIDAGAWLGMAVFSTALVLLSMLLPRLPRERHKRRNLRNLLLTVSVRRSAN